MSSIKTRITEAMKVAMKSKAKDRLSAIRLILAAFKQKEVDFRIEIDDNIAIQILSQLAKQRQESIKTFMDAKRDDLREKEEAELDIIHEFLPPPLDKDSIEQLINEAMQKTAASTMQDMGKVMKYLTPHLQGRANLKEISEHIRSLLNK